MPNEAPSSLACLSCISGFYFLCIYIPSLLGLYLGTLVKAQVSLYGSEEACFLGENGNIEDTFL